MFSQLRQAVETFTPQQRPELPHSRSSSADVNSTGAASRKPKTTLEERLRASFSIGDASNTTSANTSARASPMLNTKTPMSPASTPLPDSPALNDHELPPVFSPAPHTPSMPVLGEEPTLTALPADPLGAMSMAPSQASSPPAPAVEESNQQAPSQTPDEPELAPIFEAVQEPEQVVETKPDAEPSVSSTPTLDVDALQERLKLVEQRFSDVSTSFKRLQAEKRTADAILRELTPLETLSESEALRDYLTNITVKTEMFQEEIKRLNGKLQMQDDRFDELRDTHRLESKSQSDQIDSLRRQLSEAEALVNTSQSVIIQRDNEASSHAAEIASLKTELEEARRLQKEREAKEAKAIGLLRTARQSMAKAQQERDAAVKELGGAKQKELSEREKALAEKASLTREVEAANAEKDRALNGMKAQFDREKAALRDRLEQETLTLRGQLELEAITAKSNHSKELSAKAARVEQLERTVEVLTRDKNSFFDQLQMRQAQVESSQSHLESLQNQNTELDYQLRQSIERASLLTEELAELRLEQELRMHEPSTFPSVTESGRLLSEQQSKYEAKLSDLRRALNVAEKERNDVESEWSKKLKEKVRELEDMRNVIGSATTAKEKDEGVVESLHEKIKSLNEEVAKIREQERAARKQIEEMAANDFNAQQARNEVQAKIAMLQTQLEESKAHENQLRVSNKTLRDELRKVQSSAALLEKQRNPGVGYWTTKENGGDSRTSMSSETSRPATPTQAAKQEEEVNLEYVRNVILQFLEHKEMRPNLVRVLSKILRFTPQETRRLVAKV